MVSSSLPRDALQLAELAHRKGAKFAWNQDGVAYPAWCPRGWEKENEAAASLLHAADYVFYQSEFSRFSSDRFLGPCNRASEVLYNAVNTKVFCPTDDGSGSRKDELVLLTAGSQFRSQRIESSIRALAHVRRAIDRARLMVAGTVSEGIADSVRNLVADLGLNAHVSLLGPFTQEGAPEVFRQCDILVHPKVNDPCPGVVIEAMACGLPVVYSDSGGTPELVGEEAGVGVPTQTTWEKEVQPPPEAWADAVLAVARNLRAYSQAARRRAVEKFDLKPWIERHRQVFSELLGFSKGGRDRTADITDVHGS